MAYTATNSNRTRMVRVLHLLAPSKATAGGEVVIAVGAFIVGVPLPVHLILAAIVDVVLHATRRRQLAARVTLSRLK